MSKNLDSYNDADDISAWAEEAMEWAVSTGLVKGSDNALMPDGNANRNQVAQILMNYMCK